MHVRAYTQNITGFTCYFIRISVGGLLVVYCMGRFGVCVIYLGPVIPSECFRLQGPKWMHPLGVNYLFDFLFLFAIHGQSPAQLFMAASCSCTGDMFVFSLRLVFSQSTGPYARSMGCMRCREWKTIRCGRNLIVATQSNPCCACAHWSGGRCIMFNIVYKVQGCGIVGSKKTKWIDSF